MSPEYDKLYDAIEKQSYRSDILIRRLEGDSNEEICRKYDIWTFPKLVLFKPFSTEPFVMYKGKRDLEAFVNFLNKNAWEEFINEEPIQTIPDIDPSKVDTNIVIVKNHRPERFTQMKDDIKFLHEKLTKIEREFEILRNDNMEDLFGMVKTLDFVFIGVVLFIIIAFILIAKKIYNKL